MVTKLSLVRVRINRGGYAPEYGHRYFGLGEPLYCASSDYITQFVRAASREEAKRKVTTELNDRRGLGPVAFHR
jgi:hypothetical protein